MSGRDSGEQWAPSISVSDRKSLLGKTPEDVLGESSAEARMRIKLWGLRLSTSRSVGMERW